jgi:hypothetical protein
MCATMPARYRATGADPPWGDPRGYHGVGMEGYFWRITEPRRGVVVVVLVAVNRDAAGGTWGMLAMAAHPGGLVREAMVDRVTVARGGLGLRLDRGDGRPVLEAGDDRLRVDLSPDARLDVEFADRTLWPERFVFGGIGPAQAIPGLSQYWHPWLLGARVRGCGAAGPDALALDGATAYAEKNWGAGGHPPEWWWGQAHGFAERPDACAAFAGGRARLGPLALPRATSIVVALGGDVVRVVAPPVPLRVAVGADGWRLRARGARYRVDIEGHAGGTAPHLLPVPVPPERRRREGLSAMHLAGTLHVRLRRGRRLVFAGTSALAGLERGLGPLSPAPRPGGP